MNNIFELVLHPIVNTRNGNITEDSTVYRSIILGSDQYYITGKKNLFHLVSKICIDKLGVKGHPAPDVLHYTCEWGIKFANKHFNGAFRILNKNTVVAIEENELFNNFLFREYNGKEYIYDPSLFEQCIERLSNYYPSYNQSSLWDKVHNITAVENEDIQGNNLTQFLKNTNCGIFKIEHSEYTQAFLNEIERYVESTPASLEKTTSVVYDMFSSAVNDDMNSTNSTVHTLLYNITESATNLINETATIAQGNIYDYLTTTVSYDQNSDQEANHTIYYTAIGGIVLASIATAGAALYAGWKWWNNCNNTTLPQKNDIEAGVALQSALYTSQDILPMTTETTYCLETSNGELIELKNDGLPMQFVGTDATNYRPTNEFYDNAPIKDCIRGLLDINNQYIAIPENYERKPYIKTDDQYKPVQEKKAIIINDLNGGKHLMSPEVYHKNITTEFNGEIQKIHSTHIDLNPVHDEELNLLGEH